MFTFLNDCNSSRNKIRKQLILNVTVVKRQNCYYKNTKTLPTPGTRLNVFKKQFKKNIFFPPFSSLYVSN